MTQRQNGQTSVVASCDVTQCRYNEQQECHAGQIQVSMKGNTAECATYTPRSEGQGAGEAMRKPS